MFANLPSTHCLAILTLRCSSKEAHAAPVHPVRRYLDGLTWDGTPRLDAWLVTYGGAAEADILHLHHLTPIHEAAARVAPEVPVVGHLHGTELLMLREIDDGPPAGWEHAAAWADLSSICRNSAGSVQLPLSSRTSLMKNVGVPLTPLRTR
jgi:hypothetical protein